MMLYECKVENKHTFTLLNLITWGGNYFEKNRMVIQNQNYQPQKWIEMLLACFRGTTAKCFSTTPTNYTMRS